MRPLALALVVSGVIACTDLGAPSPEPDGDPGPVMVHTQTPAENGQTTSIGGSPTCEAAHCAEAAAEAVRAYAASNATAPELRHSECHEGACLMVVRVGDACYGAESLYTLRTPESCSASDADIIRRYLASLEVPAATLCPVGGAVPAPGGGASPGAPAQPASGPVAPETGACVVAREPEVCVERAPQEWQGLRVCSPYTPCEVSAWCGMARACIDGQCRACARDEDCASGEGCALDHCVLLANLECRSVRDCPPDQRCLLSGYTGGTPRANEDMHAYCAGSGGPARQWP